MMPAQSGFRSDIAERTLAMPVAAALGLTYDELADGRATTRVGWRPELSHVPGAFQANPIAALADFAGAGAAVTLLPPGSSAVTADYTVKFVSEARGEELIARARVVRPGRTLTVATVDVFVVAGGAETLCATALVTTRNH